MPREDKVPHATKETQISEVLISTGATLPVCGWKAWPSPNQGMVPRPECGAEKKYRRDLTRYKPEINGRW